jgi:hypothetical protein
MSLEELLENIFLIKSLNFNLGTVLRGLLEMRYQNISCL